MGSPCFVQVSLDWAERASGQFDSTMVMVSLEALKVLSETTRTAKAAPAARFNKSRGKEDPLV